MYLQHFGFKDKPFTLVPNPEYLYFSSRHSLALTYLEYGLQENLGFILLTGEVGAGKTTLIRYLLGRIEQDMEVAVLFNTNVSAEELIRLILRELEIEEVSQDKSGNLDRLNQYLIQRFAQDKRVVLIIDEAQNLSMQAMEEVRMLSNLSTESQPLLQIILVGQPELRSYIQQGNLRQLAQRISVNYHLKPLNRSEVAEYIDYRLQKSGADAGDIFQAGAVDLIFEHSGGTPRMINVLCEACLVYAYADDSYQVDREIVEQVLSDRQQDWGAEQQAVQDQEGSAAPEGAQSPPDQAWQQMQGQLQGLKQRLAWLESEVRDLGQAHKDQIGAWLERQLQHYKKENRRLSYLYGQSRQKNQELKDRLQALQPDEAEKTSAATNTGSHRQQAAAPVSVSASQQGQPQESQPEKPPGSFSWGKGLLWTVAGISAILLLLELYLTYNGIWLA
ncbi:MAG: ExeA family protein [Desulfohalobiaceae bacterium]